MDRLYTRKRARSEVATFREPPVDQDQDGPLNADTTFATPMQPKPLLRTLANPLLDHEGDDLHCAGNVDFAAGIACRPDFFGQFGAETVVFQPHHAGAVDGTVEMPRRVEQVADSPASGGRRRSPEHRGCNTGRPECRRGRHARAPAQFSWAHPDRSKSVRPCARCGFPSAIGRCAQYSAFGRAPRCPGCRWSRRLRAVPNSPDVRQKSTPACHRPTACGTVRCLVAQVRCALASDPPDHSSITGRDAQTRRPFGRDCPSIRAGSRRYPLLISPGTRHEIGAANSAFREEGADTAHHRPAEVRHLVRIDHADGFEYANRKGADDCIACALDATPHARNTLHRNTLIFGLRMIFSEFRPQLFGITR